MNAIEIVRALDGTNAAARFFGVQPASVSEWLRKGVIPEERLIRRAAKLEQQLQGLFSRRSQWPDEFDEIWPELERRKADPGEIRSERRSHGSQVPPSESSDNEGRTHAASATR